MQAGGGDRGAGHRGRWRALLGLGILAIVAYAATLVATAPARVALLVIDPPPALQRLSGTVWSGEAMLDGGLVASWRVDPLASLLSGAVRADWTLAGADTRLSGAARLSPSTSELRDVEGVAGWSLVRAAMPQAGLECDANARVSIARLRLEGGAIKGAGELTSPPGVCRPAGQDDADPVETPALRADMRTTEAGLELTLFAQADPTTALGALSLAPDGPLIITVHPAGARLVPGMPSSADSVLELPNPFTDRSPPDR